jgi:hypothetical protein
MPQFGHATSPGRKKQKAALRDKLNCHRVLPLWLLMASPESTLSLLVAERAEILFSLSMLPVALLDQNTLNLI